MAVAVGIVALVPPAAVAPGGAIVQIQVALVVLIRSRPRLPSNTPRMPLLGSEAGFCSPPHYPVDRFKWQSAKSLSNHRDPAVLDPFLETRK